MPSACYLLCYLRDESDSAPEVQKTSVHLGIQVQVATVQFCSVACWDLHILLAVVLDAMLLVEEPAEVGLEVQHNEVLVPDVGVDQ